MRRLLLVLLLAVPLAGDHIEVYTIAPASGPTAGGNTVTIAGNFHHEAFGVVFGFQASPSVERVDEHTLRAIVPPQLPGRVNVRVFEGDRFVGTTMRYTYEGAVPETLERFLVPVFVPPVRGAFGSEFRTDFRAREKETLGILLMGVQARDGDVLYLSGSATGYEPRDVLYTGTPGRFFYVRDEHAEKFSTNLRVYDTSRAAEHLGTEIPVVREREFDRRILLLGVPTDARYRSTLRIYGLAPGTVSVTVGDAAPFAVALQGAGDVYEPAYAQLTDFAIAMGTVDVKIESDAPVWAFVSVTNNETQLISTITP